MTRPTFGDDFSHPSGTASFRRFGPGAEAPGYYQSPLRGSDAATYFESSRRTRPVTPELTHRPSQ